MRVLAFFLALSLAGPAFSGETQFDLNVKANEGLREVRKEMESKLQAIRKANKDDKKFLSALKKSQAAWEAQVRADLQLIFPHSDERLYYGSVYPMCAAIQQEALVKARIQFLEPWIKGFEEGDVCSGSAPDRR